MYKETKIATPIFQKDEKSILRSAKEYIEKGADILELRIDAIINPNPNMVKKIIKKINFPLIATNRKKSEGGSFNGSEKERIAILQECCDIVDYVDIELKTDKKYIKSIKDSGVKTIISFHDFKKTPRINELINIVKKEKELGDIAKIAVMPETLEDTINILYILSKYDKTIAISMGELGSYTRIIASKFNAPIIFAAVSNELTAPGQIDIETMRLILNNSK